MMKAFELYASRRVMESEYARRVHYVEHLISERSPYLQLFSNVEDVRRLVFRQDQAHEKCVNGEVGWQAAAVEAGIWDDEKEAF
jgi:hypothetical protein